MAPELDRKYGKLYAYLQDDVTRKEPSMSLILDLLCSTWEEKMKARKHFDRDGALFKYHLIRFTDERKSEPMLSRPLAADGKAISYVLGPGGQCKVETHSSEAAIWPDETIKKMLNLIDHIKSTGRGLITLQGPYGAGKKEAAKFICKGLSIGIKSIDLDVLASKEKGFEAALAYDLRDALLERSAAYLSRFEVLTGPEAARSEAAMNAEFNNIIIKALDGFPGIAFLAHDEPLNLDARLHRAHYRIEIPLQSYQMRSRVWQSYLNGRFRDDQIGELATKFKFTAGQIADAVKEARNLAVLDGRDRESITIKDLYEGSRNQSNRKISTLARRIEARYTWDDIILPEDRIRQLREVSNHIKHRGLVYHDWGFDGKMSLGKGLNVLFLGPSGTGKTMAAEVMSTELGLDLYKIDLSSIVSKYIGETEKNLSKIFNEAEHSNAILFFDEADALFGKRSEVRDSHDRYANVEISYLLQKMEEHEGVVIMASNLSGNIDDAFLRRMHFRIEFPFPDDAFRHRIWKSMMPNGAPLANDIDYEFLSRTLKISGGNIKNIIVNSAFLAADDSRIIEMKHIIAATKREYQKMKMICSQSEFGKYYDLKP
jgi:SpoVK/Ycf46/Vps4 family AAA+-type ATPase